MPQGADKIKRQTNMPYTIIYTPQSGFEFYPYATDRVKRGRIWRTFAPVKAIQDDKLKLIFHDYKAAMDPETGCINWVGPTRFSKDGSERPHIKLADKEYSVTRLSLAIKFGVEYDTLPIPGIRARCENELCVNPDHLAPRGKYGKRVRRDRIEVTGLVEDNMYTRPTPLEMTPTFATADDILKTSNATPNEEIDFEALRAAVQLTPEMVAKKEERKREMEQAEKEARLEIEQSRRERRERRRETKVSIKDLISEEEDRTKQAMKEIDESNAAIRKQVEDLANGAPLTKEGIELATDLLSNVEKKETGEQ
jgi:hypothetical protein